MVTIHIDESGSRFRRWMDDNTVTFGGINYMTLESIARCNLQGAVVVDNIAPSIASRHYLPTTCIAVVRSPSTTTRMFPLWATAYIVDHAVYDTLIPSFEEQPS